MQTNHKSWIKVYGFGVMIVKCYFKKKKKKRFYILYKIIKIKRAKSMNLAQFPRKIQDSTQETVAMSVKNGDQILESNHGFGSFKYFCRLTLNQGPNPSSNTRNNHDFYERKSKINLISPSAVALTFTAKVNSQQSS